MGTILALAAAAALVWLILHIVKAEEGTTPDPTVPTESDFPSFLTDVPTSEGPT